MNSDSAEIFALLVLFEFLSRSWLTFLRLVYAVNLETLDDSFKESSINQLLVLLTYLVKLGLKVEEPLETLTNSENDMR